MELSCLHLGLLSMIGVEGKPYCFYQIFFILSQFGLVALDRGPVKTLVFTLIKIVVGTQDAQ